MALKVCVHAQSSGLKSLQEEVSAPTYLSAGLISVVKFVVL